MMAMRVKQEEEEEEEGNWSELPCHVLHEIMDRFSGSTSDYIRCGTVCVSWRSAFNDHHNPCILPLLMVPYSFSTFTSSSSNENSTFTSSSSSSPAGYIFYQDAKNKKKNKNNRKKKNKKQLVRRFYNISNGKVDDMFKVRMPRYSQCRGSSHGWLIIVDDVEPFHVRLFNPFFSSSMMSSSKRPSPSSSSSSLEGFVLPSLKDFPTKMSRWNPYQYHSLHKAVLSADPISNPTDYIVMIIYGGCSELAFHKSGDRGWTRIKSPSIKDSKNGFFEDVIYYQNKFFAIHNCGIVVVCDDLAAGAAARVILEPPEPDEFMMKMYLVESSSGDLLQVHRNVSAIMSDGRFIYSTIGFRVFKLLLIHNNHPTKAQDQIATSTLEPSDYERVEIATSALEPSDYEWVEVETLCGDTLFLGRNASISIPTSEYDYTGCKPNSIYYTDDSDFYIGNVNDGPHDIGIFNLEDGTFERYFSTDLNNTSIRPIPIWPSPIWIQPSLQKRNQQQPTKL